MYQFLRQYGRITAKRYIIIVKIANLIAAIIQNTVFVFSVAGAKQQAVVAIQSTILVGNNNMPVGIDCAVSIPCRTGKLLHCRTSQHNSAPWSKSLWYRDSVRHLYRLLYGCLEKHHLLLIPNMQHLRLRFEDYFTIGH